MTSDCATAESAIPRVVAIEPAGADSLYGSSGADRILPGADKDTVDAGSGNDEVVVLDLCEVADDEVLDGGADTDTLWLPAGVTVTDLQTIGVTVSNFEVVDEIEGGAWGMAECALNP